MRRVDSLPSPCSCPCPCPWTRSWTCPCPCTQCVHYGILFHGPCSSVHDGLLFPYPCSSVHDSFLFPCPCSKAHGCLLFPCPCSSVHDGLLFLALAQVFTMVFFSLALVLDCNVLTSILMNFRDCHCAFLEARRLYCGCLDMGSNEPPKKWNKIGLALAWIFLGVTWRPWLPSATTADCHYFSQFQRKKDENIIICLRRQATRF
jgi:hypothetical protein